MSSFKVTSKFREAAGAINLIPIDKFPLLLGRIFSVLHLKNSKLFKTEEEEQLMALFGISEDTLKLVLDACCYIFEQVRNDSIYNIYFYDNIIIS